MGECHFVICIRPRAVHFIGCHLFVSRILVTSSMCTLHLQRSQYTHRIRVSWFVTGGARGHLNRGPNEIRFQFSQSSIKFAAKAVVGEHLQSPNSAKQKPRKWNWIFDFSQLVQLHQIDSDRWSMSVISFKVSKLQIFISCLSSERSASWLNFDKLLTGW